MTRSAEVDRVGRTQLARIEDQLSSISPSGLPAKSISACAMQALIISAINSAQPSFANLGYDPAAAQHLIDQHRA
jgi:hypothetical protein